MIVVGLDPGYRESAIVSYNGTEIIAHDICDNETMFIRLQEAGQIHTGGTPIVLVLEQMQMFKSAFGVGVEVFDSVYWSGQFAHAWRPKRVERLLRSKVRGHLGASKGGDAMVRAALIGKFGPYKEQAIGKKATPGPLYGITSHEWSALAIAVTWWDLHHAAAPTIRPGVTAEF